MQTLPALNFMRPVAVAVALFLAGAPVIDYVELPATTCCGEKSVPCGDPGEGHCGALCQLSHGTFLPVSEDHGGQTFFITFLKPSMTAPYHGPLPGDVPVPPV